MHYYKCTYEGEKCGSNPHRIFLSDNINEEKGGLLMASYYYQNLIKSVLEASTTDKWEIAVREWNIVDC